MKRRYISLISVLLLITMLFTGCVKPVNKTIITESFSSPGKKITTDRAETQKNVTDSFSYSIWSHQLSDEDDASSYVEKLKACDVDTIELNVLWSDFQVDKNIFSWTFLDSVLDVFTKAGFKLNLAIVFWTYDLAFENDLDLQKTATGQIFSYDTLRRSFISISSDKNIHYVKDAVLAFASHVISKYSEYILSWQIKLSESGDLEYSSAEDLDYSDSSFDSFLGYLINKYSTIERFDRLYECSFGNWTELREQNMISVVKICPFDWKLFKQQELANFHNSVEEIFRFVDPSIPVAISVSIFGDSLSSAYRGVFDPYSFVSSCNCDIIYTKYYTEKQKYYYLDLLLSTTDVKIDFILDGPWKSDEIIKTNDELAKIIGSSGISKVTLINWTKDDLDKHSSDIMKYKESIHNTSYRPDADMTDIIIINTLDFIMRKPPYSLYDLTRSAYRNIFGSTSRRVIIYTDTQVMENPSLLEGVKKIHLGSLNNVTYMYDALGDLLIAGRYTIIDNNNQQPNFLNEFEQPLNSDVQDEIRKRLFVS